MLQVCEVTRVGHYLGTEQQQQSQIILIFFMSVIIYLLPFLTLYTYFPPYFHELMHSILSLLSMYKLIYYFC